MSEGVPVEIGGVPMSSKEIVKVSRSIEELRPEWKRHNSISGGTITMVSGCKGFVT